MTNDPLSPSLPPDSGESTPDAEPAIEPASGPWPLPEPAPAGPPAKAAAPPSQPPAQYPLAPQPPAQYPLASQPPAQYPLAPQPPAQYPPLGPAWNQRAPWSPQAQWSGPAQPPGYLYPAGASSRPRRPRSPAAWVALGAALVLVASFFFPWASFRIVGGAFSFDYSTSLMSMISDDLATFDPWLICLILGAVAAMIGSVIVVAGSQGAACKATFCGFAAAAIGTCIGIVAGFGGGFMDAMDPAFGAWLAVVAASVGVVASVVLIVSPNYGISTASLAPAGPWQPYQGQPGQPWRHQGPASYLPAVYSPAPPSFGSPTPYAPAASSGYQSSPNAGPATPPAPASTAPPPFPPAPIYTPPPVFPPPPAYPAAAGFAPGEGGPPRPTYPQAPIYYPGYPPAPTYTPTTVAGLATIPGRLVVVDGGHSTEYSVNPGHGFTVGRETGCSLVFTDPTVGERQVAIERRGDGWLVQNVDPARPTLVVDTFGRHQPIEWELGLRSGQLSIGTAMVLLYPVLG